MTNRVNLLKFAITGRIPSKKNQKQIRYNRRTRKPFIASSKDHESFVNEKIYSVKTLPKIKGRITKIKLQFFSKDKRKYDLTNKAETIIDLLVDAKIIEDDNYSILDNVNLEYIGLTDEHLCLISIYYMNQPNDYEYEVKDFKKLTASKNLYKII